jgi:hypothetical protein
MASETTAETSAPRKAPPPQEAHHSFLVYRRFLHLKLSMLLVAVSIALYVWHAPMAGPSGGTWLGFTLGTIGALIIVWLTWFGWRKRSYGSTRISLASWLSAHVYFGLTLLIVATLHTGFQFGPNVHTLSYVLMVLVIFSGIFGIFAYTRYPRLITANRHGATQTQLLGRIASIDGEIRQAIMGTGDAVVRVVAPAIERDDIGGTVWRQLSARYPNCSTAAALQQVQALGRTMELDQQIELRSILVLLAQKAELLERVRRDIQYKALMEIWLYVHVPITFALLAALLVHIISVFFYW